MNQIDRFVLICHFLWSAWVSIIIANHRSPHTLSLCFHLQGSGSWPYAGLSLLDVKDSLIVIRMVQTVHTSANILYVCILKTVLTMFQQKLYLSVNSE